VLIGPKESIRTVLNEFFVVTDLFDNFNKEETMLYWVLLFFIISIIAAVFGFTGIAVAAAGVAKILFYLFLILFILTLIFGIRGRTRI
jgi:uncharacterized membrane protein YtjA (UPF0391 family)